MIRNEFSNNNISPEVYLKIIYKMICSSSNTISTKSKVNCEVKVILEKSFSFLS